MNILFGVHSYKPAYKVGGPIHSVSAVAEKLVQRGHSVTVCTSNWNLTEPLEIETGVPHEINGVKVVYFPVRNPLKPLAALSKSVERLSNYNFVPDIHRYLRANIASYDVAHTHLPFVYPTLAIARHAISASVPLCYHQRGVFDPARLNYKAGKKKAYFELVERPHLRKASRLFALTEAERESYRALELEAPVEIVPNGVEAPLPEAAGDRDYLARIGIGESDKLILFLGRLHPIKGVDVLIEAFQRLAEAHPDAKLVLAGPDEDGRLATWMSPLRAAGLGERVIVTGTVHGEQKAALLRRSDIFCLPSAAEGFSMAILEAMAASTAVVISPGCHFSEVESAGAGIVAATTADALADAICRLLASPETAAEMGRRAQQLVAQNYRWDSIAERFENIYQAVVDQRRSQKSI